jgi:hypothetical protein
MVSLMNTTEQSFYDFVKKSGKNIEKIATSNSPDFLVDGLFAFEVKELTESGTAITDGHCVIQKINVKNFLNNKIRDAAQKINNYKNLQTIIYYGLVIYNSRFMTPEKITSNFPLCIIKNYPCISSLICPGYNKNKNQNITQALTIYNCDKTKIQLEQCFFQAMNVRFITI